MNCYKLDYLGISKFKLKLGKMYVFKRHSTTVILLAYVQKLLKLDPRIIKVTKELFYIGSFDVRCLDDFS